MKPTRKQIDKRARAIREAVARKVSKIRGTLADYRKFAECYFAGDYCPMQGTKLYVAHGLEYCLALEANYEVK